MRIAHTYPVVLDANVLFSFMLRDVILRAAASGLCQPHWSPEILEEVRRNLVEQGRTSEAGATSLLETMDEIFPESSVTGYEQRLIGLANHKDDRHVVAAALAADVQVIVTSNLADFDPLPEAMRAVTPDAFLCELFDHAPTAILEVLRSQVRDYRRPPLNFEELLSDLEQRYVPKLISRIRNHLESPA